MKRLDEQFQVGLRYLNRGNPRDAVLAFESILDEGFRNAVLLSTYGNALKALGHYEKAVAACREASGLMPGNLQCDMNLGSALLASGDWEGAVATYQGALANHPGESEIHFNLGTAWLKDEIRGRLLIASARGLAGSRVFQAWMNPARFVNCSVIFTAVARHMRRRYNCRPMNRAQWNLSLRN